MGADYSFYVKTIETHARAFLTLKIFAIGTFRVLPDHIKLALCAKASEFRTIL